MLKLSNSVTQYAGREHSFSFPFLWPRNSFCAWLHPWLLFRFSRILEHNTKAQLAVSRLNMLWYIHQLNSFITPVVIFICTVESIRTHDYSLHASLLKTSGCDIFTVQNLKCLSSDKQLSETLQTVFSKCMRLVLMKRQTSRPSASMCLGELGLDLNRVSHAGGNRARGGYGLKCLNTEQSTWSAMFKDSAV